MFNINFADDWIRTTDLWNRKRPLYQLSHNHYQQKIVYIEMSIFKKLHNQLI